MKKLLVIIMGLISFCSCQDHLIIQEDFATSCNESIAVNLDSLTIYMRQTSKGEMLKNLIRCENDRFYLDLSSEEAFELGISSSTYENVKNQMEQLNNSNIKLK